MTTYYLAAILVGVMLIDLQVGEPPTGHAVAATSVVRLLLRVLFLLLLARILIGVVTS